MKQFYDAGRQIFSDCWQGKDVSWETFDAFIVWIGFCLGWFLRLPAFALGPEAAPPLIAAAAITDLVTAYLSVCIATYGTMRDVNGFLYDVPIMIAFLRAAMFMGPEYDVEKIDTWVWKV